MGWKDDMRQASFRGVEFHVADGDADGGRRVVIHKYPQRETHYTEDLGGEPLSFPVTGFLVGDDVLSQRDTLMAALQESGPGQLVHPWHGTMDVVCLEWSFKYSVKHGGMVQVTMKFVKEGAAVNPGSALRTSDALFSSARTAQDTSLESFGNIFDADLPSPMQLTTAAKVSAVVDTILDVRTVVQDADAWASTASEVLASPLDPDVVGAGLLGLIDEAGFESVTDVVDAASRLDELLTLVASFSGRAAATYSTPSRIQEAANLNAVTDLVVQSSIAEAAVAASAYQPETTVEAERIQADITEALDGVLETTGDDEVYAAFSDLRSAVVLDMAERARHAKRIKTWTTRSTMPALAVAHRACDAGALESDDLVTRNNVRHPGFVPPGSLEVVVDG